MFVDHRRRGPPMLLSLYYGREIFAPERDDFPSFEYER